MIDYIIIGFVFIPIIFGLLQYILKKVSLKYSGLIMQGLLLLTTLYLVVSIDFSEGWFVPLLNVETPVGMALNVDQLSLVMILINNFVFLIMSYASHHRTYYNKLFIFLVCCLQGLINGVFLSSDFFNVYLLIELATIIVSVLVMYKKDGRSLYDGMIYLIINMVGMAFFLFGIGYIYKIFGVLDYQSVGDMMHLVPQSSLVLPFAFLMTGASLKAAFMPLFSWLPKAHGTASAPTIISAILSGIFVKTGIYLFVRISYLFSPVINLSTLFFTVAVATAIIGAIFAMSHTDIKLILSYSTISQVGIIMLGLSNVSETGYASGTFYLMNHALFKVLLFFCVGLIIKMYNTRDTQAIHGLWYRSKLVSIGLIIGLLSLTGFPLLASGIGKYMISDLYKQEWIRYLFLLLNMTSMLYCLPLFGMIFSKANKKESVLKPNQRMTIVILLLSILGMSVFYQVIIDILFSQDFRLNMDKLVGKVIEYALVSGMAYLIFRSRGHLAEIRKGIRRFDLSFNAINFGIVTYFIVLVIATKI